MIVEQGKFCDLGSEAAIENKLLRLHIVRASYEYQHHFSAAISVATWCAYTVMMDDLSKYPTQPGFPEEWEHIGAHERIGRMYWNYFHTRHPGGVLCFHDAPDFSGRLRSGIPFVGDINQVGAISFVLAMTQMPRRSLWISVSEKRQVVLEPLVDMTKFGAAAFCDPSPEELMSNEPDEVGWRNCTFAEGHRMPLPKS